MNNNTVTNSAPVSLTFPVKPGQMKDDKLVTGFR